MRLRDAAWSRKAQVVGSPYPRSYLVKTEDQKLLRRNRRHLLQTGERFIEESDDDIDASSADNNVGGHPTVATSTSPANGRRRDVGLPFATCGASVNFTTDAIFKKVDSNREATTVSSL
ncbi:hypothetical protein MRX96_030166 [Rhipicephalus microplus]